LASLESYSNGRARCRPPACAFIPDDILGFILKNVFVTVTDYDWFELTPPIWEELLEGCNTRET